MSEQIFDRFDYAVLDPDGDRINATYRDDADGETRKETMQ